MPQGPAHWHQHWGDDGHALEYLSSRGFTWRSGVIRPDRPSFVPDNLDLAAIEYLCAEWDYAYEP